ncbi:hypothetical protein ANCDUO_12855 [Ancylostoma duodenale]|uniref:Uncharacterized protein n=1 Tax=Ancylostoma duodenale TaxID=51022 RepID=A0A0C2G7N1_9BILA|nr:hypothetical protein ANCDUO_12855 [Ancylostoma duodenale]
MSERTSMKTPVQILVSVFAMFGVLATYRSALTCTPTSAIGVQPRAARNSALIEPSTPTEAQRNDHDDLLFHPFDNACKFVMPNTYASDIVDITTGWLQ